MSETFYPTTTDYEAPASQDQRVPVIPNLQDFYAPAGVQYPSWQNAGAEANDARPSIPVVPAVPIVQVTFEFDPTVAADLLVARSFGGGFNAKALVIDNATQQWWYCATLRQWIPPFIHGKVANIVAGSDSIDFAAVTPVGQTSNPIAGQKLTVTIWSLNLDPTDGVTLTTFSGTVEAVIEGAIALEATLAGVGKSLFFDPSVTNVVEQMKATAGKLYDLLAYNPNGTIGFLQVFMLPAASVTLGTTVPNFVLPVPALGEASKDWGDVGANPGTGISYAFTTTATGNTAMTTPAMLDGSYI